VHERLVESWLDNASERSYQAPFCQMLAAEGHRVVHSTRHSPLEFGKDVVTVGPDGRPWAFQLKGNPGSRLTLLEFRNIENQLRQLCDTALPYPDLSAIQHRSVLVTNGLIEEETTIAIEAMNRANANAGYPDRRLEVFQRGDLLDMAKRLGHTLWPAEVQQVHLLLEMLVEEGNGAFPSERANQMLLEMLGLASAAKRGWSASEARRRISSAALLTAISLRNFEVRENHFATVSAWAQFAAAAVAVCDRYGISFNKNARASVELALTAIKDAMVDLAQEVLIKAQDKGVLIEGDPKLEAVFYRARYTLLLGLLSLLWLWCERDGWPADLRRDDVSAFLKDGRSQLLLWGEAAVPQFLPYVWFMRRITPGLAPDTTLTAILDATVAQDAAGEPGGLLASPYWDYEAVARHGLAGILPPEDPMQNESIGGRSFFAEPLLHLLVRSNLKSTCRNMWPKVSRVQFARFTPRLKWQYCLSHSDEGEEADVQPPLRKSWTDLVEEARSIRCEVCPTAMLDMPILHALFVLLFPYRGTPDVVRRLAYEFDRTWLIGDPIA
jgi:hypothetical protein